MASYSLFGPFVLLKQLPDEEARTFRARRFVDGGGLTGAVSLSRFGPPDDRALGSLTRRARWGEDVAHPAVVRTLEIGTVEAELYALYEIAEGPTLAELLSSADDDGPPPVPVCIAIAAQLAALAREIYELAAGELLVGYLTPEHVTLSWDGRVRVRAGGSIPHEKMRGDKKDRDPFVAPELQKGATPSLSTEAWTVARLLRAALAGDPTGRDTPKVSAAYKDSLGPLLISSLARRPSERMLMPALEERLLAVLQDTGDNPLAVIAEHLFELYGDRVSDDDDELLGEDILAQAEHIYLNAPLPELHFPSDHDGGGAFGEESATSNELSARNPSPQKTSVNQEPNLSGEFDSAIFGRILEEHSEEKAPYAASVSGEASEEGVDLEAIALRSIDDEPALADPDFSIDDAGPVDDDDDLPGDTQTAVPAPQDTAVSDVGALGADELQNEGGGTDLMNAPPPGVLDSLDEEERGVFSEDGVFEGDGPPTRTDPVPAPSQHKKRKASSDGAVSAIFTRSVNADAARRAIEGLEAADEGGATRSLRRPSREELWSDVATDPGRSPASGGSGGREVFANSGAGEARPADDEDPDATAYLRERPKPSRSEEEAAAVARAASLGDDDPNKTLYLDNPAGAGADELSETEAPVPSAPAGRVDDFPEDESTTRLSADVARAIAAGAPSRAEALLAANEKDGGSGASAWGKPITRSEPDPNATALLPVHDVRDVLNATQARDPRGADKPEPASIAEVLPDDPELGILVVDVADGAVVFLNGEQVGVGRTVIHDLDRFVSYVVRVHLRKHAPWTGTVTLQGMRAARVEPDLVPRGR